jgi:hypothetical protein
MDTSFLQPIDITHLPQSKMFANDFLIRSKNRFAEIPEISSFIFNNLQKPRDTNFRKSFLPSTPKWPFAKKLSTHPSPLDRLFYDKWLNLKKFLHIAYFRKSLNHILLEPNKYR